MPLLSEFRYPENDRKKQVAIAVRSTPKIKRQIALLNDLEKVNKHLHYDILLTLFEASYHESVFRAVRCGYIRSVFEDGGYPRNHRTICHVEIKSLKEFIRQGYGYVSEFSEKLKHEFETLNPHLKQL